MWFVVQLTDVKGREGRANEAVVGCTMQAGAEDLTFQALLTNQKVMTPFNQRWCTECGSRVLKARLRQRESHDPSSVA